MCQAVMDAYPQEGCGLILGRRLMSATDRMTSASLEAADREAIAVIPVANAWHPSVLDYTDPAITPATTVDHGLGDRYWIDPATLLEVQRSARQQDLDIIGIYHSHPDHPAVPSECDRRLAWPVYSYLIIAVSHGQVIDLNSWRLNDEGQFQLEPVKILGSSANNLPFLS
ncbi:MAG: M67 family metallopeptidase [Leptolyngbyaceae cyanobacterium SM2_5_2]|nr:M67 family metallopeptidase [Leptolyngbyaceae cyanobacterium SM2_5_2]